MSSAPYIVKSLLCHRHVAMALKCYSSLQRNSAVDLLFSIHDDGSLTPEDCNLLRANLASVHVISRLEANEKVYSCLPSYSSILNLRKSFPLLLKAVDIPLFSSGQWTFYVDSDIYWFHPFVPFDTNNLEESGINLIMMRDRSNCYSLRSWQLLLSRLQLPNCANSGFLFFKTSCIDFDFLNWFISRSLHQGILPMIEQTFFAALAVRTGGAIVDQRQLHIMRDNENIRSELIAGHFTAKTRHLLAKIDAMQSRSNPPQHDLPSEFQHFNLEPLGRCSSWNLVTQEMSRLARKVTSLSS